MNASKSAYAVSRSPASSGNFFATYIPLQDTWFAVGVAFELKFMGGSLWTGDFKSSIKSMGG